MTVNDYMELIFEILIELVLEGTLELSQNIKVPKMIRYPLIFLIVLLFIGVISLFFITGILAYQRINKICGGLFIVIGFALLISSISKFKKTYLTKRTGI